MSLTVYAGCMKSGKTESVVRDITMYVDTSDTVKVLFINSIKDVRPKEEGNIHSSNSTTSTIMSDKIDKISAHRLVDVDVSSYDVVGIDEVQFFEDLYDTVRVWVQEMGKSVYVAGLDGNWGMKRFILDPITGEPIEGHMKFGDISLLLPISDNFIKLNAICMKCLKEMKLGMACVPRISLPRAAFTAKISGTDNLVEIGSDMYEPMCRSHFNENFHLATLSHV